MPADIVCEYNNILVHFGKFMEMMSDAQRTTPYIISRSGGIAHVNGYGMAYLDKRTVPINKRHHTMKYRWNKFKERIHIKYDTRFLKLFIPFITVWAIIQYALLFN
jgi:hypothetical protein